MHRNQEKGFTLIEMSLVTVVLGIVVTITVMGTLRLVRSSRLVGATNTMVADLRHARTLATTEGRSFQILFQSGSYSIIRLAPSATVLKRFYPPGVSCTASDTATFYAWGLTAPITITLTTAEGSQVLQLASNGRVSH